MSYRSGLYLSYTGYKTMRDCPEQYLLSYIKKMRPPMEDQRNVLKGNALHHLMEAYILREKTDPQWIIDNAPLYWDKEILAVKENKYGQFIQWRNAKDEAENRATFLVWAKELARLFHKHGLRPERMNSEFKADTDTTFGGNKFRMGGRIDVLTETKTGELVVLDLKASANKAIKDLDQIVWYSIITELKTGRKIDYAGYIMPAFEEICVYKIPQEAKDALIERVGIALSDIVAERFGPRPSDKSCYWCPVKYACPLFGGGIVRDENGKASFGGEDATVDDLL